MEPIVFLMKEHRVIEDMVNALGVELAMERTKKSVDFPFLDTAIDFFKTYADMCHHGKEEGILFRELLKKALSTEHKEMMKALVAEHVFARKTVGSLWEARQAFAQGEANAIDKIIMALEELAVFYPEHIEKEDQRFFHPVMEYFSEEERENMVREFHDFDENLIHERYMEIAERSLRLKSADLTSWKCTVCEYVYDPAKGEAKQGVPPRTSFNNLPAEWKCPVCLAGKEAFKEIQ